MNKKGILVLLITVFCLTGCEATYNLTITEDSMTESVNFLNEDTPKNQNILDQYLSSNYLAYYDMDIKENKNYSQKEINENGQIGMNLTYEYAGDKLQNSSLLNRCYYKKSIIKTDDEITITTDGKTMCFYKDEVKTLDKLTINITTDLKVTENNADEINGNTYTWIIDDSNYQDHPITMKIDLTGNDGTPFSLALIAIAVIIIVGGGALLLFVRIKNKKNNKL